MKIDKQILDNHQAKLTVEIEEEKMDEMKRRAAKKIARSVKISGFRPGKAPYPVILRQVGEPAIVEEALDLLINDIYPKLIEETEIQPYGPGKLETLQSMDPPIFEFIIPLDAEVTLGDYHSISKPYSPPEISEENIDNVINNLREQQAIVEPVERPAKMGDLITIKISAYLCDPDKKEDSTKLLLEEKTLPILIQPFENEDIGNDPSELEWPFPGFSHKLIGASADDELEFDYSYPEDEKFDEFSGHQVKFKIFVENVKERILPELDDDFILSIGDFEDIDALRTRIRQNLEFEAQNSYNQDYDQAIIQQAIDQTQFRYPPQMLEDEIDKIISNFEKQLKSQNLDLDLYLKTKNLDKNGLIEEVTPTAETQLMSSLFLYELAKAEDIQIDENELKNKTVQTYDYLTQHLSKNETSKLESNKFVNTIERNIMVDMLTDNSMEYFRNIAKGLNLENTEQTILTEDDNTQLKVEVDQIEIEKVKSDMNSTESLSKELTTDEPINSTQIIDTDEQPNSKEKELDE